MALLFQELSTKAIERNRSGRTWYRAPAASKHCVEVTTGSAEAINPSLAETRLVMLISDLDLDDQTGRIKLENLTKVQNLPKR